MKNKKQKTRKKKKKIPKLLSELQTAIKDYGKYINIPNHDYEFFTYNKNLNTDLDCKISLCPNLINLNYNIPLKYDFLKPNRDSLIQATKYNLLPTPIQKNIMLGFCDAYICMYNVFVTHVKQIRKDKSQLENNINLRYCDLNYEPTISSLKKLFSNQKKFLSAKYSINSHILDAAILDALAMFKSIVSNQKNGHVKNSRFRYLKKSKSKKIFKVEKEICQDNSFCSSVIGKKLDIYPELNYKQDCKKIHTIQYNSKTDKFILIKRDPIKILKFQVPNKVISIDPGEKTLITGVSENHILEIGTNISNKLSKYLNKIKNIENTKRKIVTHTLPNGNTINKSIIKSRQQKQINKIELKIENYVNDTHWKVANYLTLNYDHILIGNLSTKNMKQKGKANNLDILKNLNMFELRNKIKYKCLIRNKKYKKVNESYTTKCCIKCGEVNDVGLSREYKCAKCGVCNGRDIKAAGCIYLKSLYTKEYL